MYRDRRRHLKNLLNSSSYKRDDKKINKKEISYMLVSFLWFIAALPVPDGLFQE